MTSLVTPLINAQAVACRTDGLSPTFSAYIDDSWVAIKDEYFYNAMYTTLFEKDKERSTHNYQIYNRKR